MSKAAQLVSANVSHVTCNLRVYMRCGQLACIDPLQFIASSLVQDAFTRNRAAGSAFRRLCLGVGSWLVRW